METEKTAQRWQRARLLRAYATALERRDGEADTGANAVEVE